MDGEQLLLEVWDDAGEDEAPLHALIYAGPLGNQARELLSPQAQLCTTFAAGNHFEAMTTYYQLMGWGVYTTDQPWDYQPYPHEWVKQQRQAGIVIRPA